MIGSELSQNMAALAAKFKAVFELLTTKSSILEKQQLVMQDDYSRISDRYNKIFQNLDEELEKRVVALDKNVFEISKHVQGEQLHSETSKKVTQFLIGVNEMEKMEKMENHFLIISASLGSQILKTYSLTKSNGEKGPELNVKDIAEFLFNVLTGKIQVREIDGKVSFDELKKNFE